MFFLNPTFREVFSERLDMTNQKNGKDTCPKQPDSRKRTCLSHYPFDSFIRKSPKENQQHNCGNDVGDVDLA